MKLGLNVFKKKTGGKNEFKCKKCSMTFEDKERLSVHSKKAHTGREKPDSHH
jgi:hypothetical protein